MWTKFQWQHDEDQHLNTQRDHKDKRHFYVITNVVMAIIYRMYNLFTYFQDINVHVMFLSVYVFSAVVNHACMNIHRPIQGGPKITERHTSGNKDIRWLYQWMGIFSWEKWYQDQPFWLSGSYSRARYISQCQVTTFSLLR